MNASLNSLIALMLAIALCALALPVPPPDPSLEPTASTLRTMPSVARVEVLVNPPRPTHLIIHVRDWHYVPEKLFALDVQQATKQKLTQQEIATLYNLHLREVDAVQQQQMRLLRRLASHHGLRKVLCEGVTREHMPTLTERIAEAREVEKDPLLRVLLVEQILDLGAVGRMMMAGESVESLPLDDAKLLDAARPITPEGRVQVKLGARQAREDFMVRQALRHGPVAVMVLGGSHDLSGSVWRLGRGRVRYVRVTVKEYPGE